MANQLPSMPSGFTLQVSLHKMALLAPTHHQLTRPATAAAMCAAVEEALVPLATTLQAFSSNISEVLVPSTVQQRDGMCPSGAWGRAQGAGPSKLGAGH